MSSVDRRSQESSGSDLKETNWTRESLQDQSEEDLGGIASALQAKSDKIKRVTNIILSSFIATFAVLAFGSLVAVGATSGIGQFIAFKKNSFFTSHIVKIVTFSELGALGGAISCGAIGSVVILGTGIKLFLSLRKKTIVLDPILIRKQRIRNKNYELGVFIIERPKDFQRFKKREAPIRVGFNAGMATQRRGDLETKIPVVRMAYDYQRSLIDASFLSSLREEDTIYLLSGYFFYDRADQNQNVVDFPDLKTLVLSQDATASYHEAQNIGIDRHQPIDFSKEGVAPNLKTVYYLPSSRYFSSRAIDSNSLSAIDSLKSLFLTNGRPNSLVKNLDTIYLLNVSETFEVGAIDKGAFMQEFNQKFICSDREFVYESDARIEIENEGGIEINEEDNSMRITFNVVPLGSSSYTKTIEIRFGSINSDSQGNDNHIQNLSTLYQDGLLD